MGTTYLLVAEFEKKLKEMENINYELLCSTIMQANRKKQPLYWCLFTWHQ